VGQRIVVYTAIFGDIDRLWSVYPLAQGDTQHVCFTDRPLREVGLWTDEQPPKIRKGTAGMGAPPTWQIELVEPQWSTRRTARHYKAVPHAYIDADVWIWVDGNVRLLVPPSVIVDKYLDGADLAIFKHPDRACLYEEARFCAKVGKDSPTVLQTQTARYEQEGMPAKWGLPETRCVIRRNTDDIRNLGDAWWSELERHSVRDQVSLPFVCWKAGLRWREIPGRCWPRNTSDDFYYVKHRG
jgi:hypothetical protein